MYFSYSFYFQKVNLCAWMFSFILLPIIVFGYYPFYQHTPKTSALVFGLFDVFSRIAWSICLSYMTFACVHDSGGPVNKFLSLPIWQPLSRLTYAIFLIHYYLITMALYSIKTPPHFSGFSAFHNFISMFVLSVFISIPLVLAFELPIDAINKLSTDSKKIKEFAISKKESLTEIQLDRIITKH